MPHLLLLQHQFKQLTALLDHHSTLWRLVPFNHPVLAWERQHPALSAALNSLDDQSAASLECDQPALVTWLADYLPGLHHLSELDYAPELTPRNTTYPTGFERDIPGRKWQQITQFVGCLDQFEGPVLEWCAGKAHLGRAISQRFQTAVSALERDANLCRQGHVLGQRQQLDVRLHQCDVLSSAVTPHLQHADHAVALHACGDLHRRLIESVTTHKLRSLDLSPCCYHLTRDRLYRPYSQAGRVSGLPLSRDECRLAVQETVTAPGISASRRARKSVLRLGFDMLQRELRGVDEYLPVPPLPEACFQGDFSTFCQTAADLKGLRLPQGIDWALYENLGRQRQARVMRMELLRHAFRRALEMWLVLDRALHLSECGYSVAVGSFCERRLTPRNLMIRATLG